MGGNKRVLFGPGYEYDGNKTQEENWEAMKAYYAKYGIEIGEMPPHDSETDKLLEEMKPQFDRILNEVVNSI